MQLASPAFKNNGDIPKVYTCDGDNTSPPLFWTGIPGNAKSLALIMDDPDAPRGTFVHWLLWNLPPSQNEIKDSIAIGSLFDNGAIQGHSDFGDQGYGGPCPPFGTHRYFFKLYALDTILDLDKNVRKADLEKAMQGHILAIAELVGLYRR